MEDRIRRQIDQYRTQREALVANANQQVAQLSGAIAALEALLVPETEAPVETQHTATEP